MDMVDWMKKSVELGLGIASLTKKEAEKIAKDVARRSGVSTKEGEKLAKQLMQTSKKHGSRMQKMVQQEVTKTLHRLGVATRKDMEKLRSELKRKKR